MKITNMSDEPEQLDYDDIDEFLEPQEQQKKKTLPVSRYLGNAPRGLDRSEREKLLSKLGKEYSSSLGKAVATTPDLFGGMEYYTVDEGKTGISLAHFLLARLAGVPVNQASIRSVYKSLDMETFLATIQDLGLPEPNFKEYPLSKPLDAASLVNALRAAGLSVRSGKDITLSPIHSGSQARDEGGTFTYPEKELTINLNPDYLESGLTGVTSVSLGKQFVFDYVPIAPGRYAMASPPEYFNSFVTGAPDKMIFFSSLRAIQACRNELSKKEVKEEPLLRGAWESLLRGAETFYNQLQLVSKECYIGATGVKEMINRSGKVAKSMADTRDSYLLYTMNIKDQKKVIGALISYFGSGDKPYGDLPWDDGSYDRILSSAKLSDDTGKKTTSIKKFMSNRCQRSDAPVFDLDIGTINNWDHALHEENYLLSTRYPVELRGKPFPLLFKWSFPGLLASDADGADRRVALPFPLYRLNPTAESGPGYGKGVLQGAPNVDAGMLENAGTFLVQFSKQKVDGLKPLPDSLKIVTATFDKRKVQIYEIKKKGVRSIYVLNAAATVPVRFMESISIKTAPQFFTNSNCLTLAKIAWTGGGMAKFFKRIQYMLMQKQENVIFIAYADNLFIIMRTSTGWVIVSTDGVKFESSHTRLSMTLEVLRRLRRTFGISLQTTTSGSIAKVGGRCTSVWMNYLLATAQSVDGPSILNRVEFKCPGLPSGHPMTFSCNEALMRMVLHTAKRLYKKGDALYTQEVKGEYGMPQWLQMSAKLNGCMLTMEKVTFLPYLYKSQKETFQSDLDLLGMGVATFDFCDIIMPVPVLDSKRFNKQMVFRKAFISKDVPHTAITYPFARYMVSLTSYLLGGFARIAEAQVINIYCAEAIKKLTNIMGQTTGHSVSKSLVSKLIKEYFKGFIPEEDLEEYESSDPVGQITGQAVAPPTKSDTLVRKLVNHLLRLKMPTLEMVATILCNKRGWYLFYPFKRVEGKEPSFSRQMDAKYGTREVYTNEFGINMALLTPYAGFGKAEVPGMSMFSTFHPRLADAIQYSTDFHSHGSIDRYFNTLRQSDRFPIPLPTRASFRIVDYFDAYYRFLDRNECEHCLYGEGEHRQGYLSENHAFEQKLRGLFYPTDAHLPEPYKIVYEEVKVEDPFSGVSVKSTSGRTYPNFKIRSLSALGIEAYNRGGPAALKVLVNQNIGVESREKFTEIVIKLAAQSDSRPNFTFLVPEGSFIHKGQPLVEDLVTGLTIMSPNAGYVRNQLQNGFLCELEPYTDDMVFHRGSASRSGAHYAGLYFFESLTPMSKPLGRYSRELFGKAERSFLLYRGTSVAEHLATFMSDNMMLEQLEQYLGTTSDYRLYVKDDVIKEAKLHRKDQREPSIQLREDVEPRDEDEQSELAKTVANPIESKNTLRNMRPGQRVASLVGGDVDAKKIALVRRSIKANMDANGGVLTINWPQFLTPVGNITSDLSVSKAIAPKTLTKKIVKSLGFKFGLNAVQMENVMKKLMNEPPYSSNKGVPFKFLNDPFSVWSKQSSVPVAELKHRADTASKEALLKYERAQVRRKARPEIHGAPKRTGKPSRKRGTKPLGGGVVSGMKARKHKGVLDESEYAQEEGDVSDRSEDEEDDQGYDQ
jgi:hypothetical protein